MATNKLKKNAIRTLPDGWYSDGNGLYLRVVNGERYWVLRKMRNGVRVVKPLGKFPRVSLADARRRVLEEVYGNDELFVKKRVYPKLDDVWQETVDHMAVVKKWKSGASKKIYDIHYRNYIKPTLGNKRTDSITTQDVLDILSPRWEGHSVYMDQVRNSLYCVFNMLLANGKAKGANPAAWRDNLSAFLPSPSSGLVHRKRAGEEELGKLFFTLPKSPVIIAIHFGTLTALRAKEFLSATWDEIDWDHGVLSVSPARRKDRKPEPFRVPLSTQAMELLKLLPQTSNYVFGKSMKADTLMYWLKANGYDFTMHGMRSVFMDWGTERGKDHILLEKSLCHATGGAVNQAYQRSDCLEQRRPIMQEWADYLYSLAQYR